MSGRLYQTNPNPGALRYTKMSAFIGRNTQEKFSPVGGRSLDALMVERQDRQRFHPLVSGVEYLNSATTSEASTSARSPGKRKVS
jgi:hypothetical protein